MGLVELSVCITSVMALTFCIALLLVSVGFVSDVAVGLLLLFLSYALFCNFDLKVIFLQKVHVQQLPKLTRRLMQEESSVHFLGQVVYKEQETYCLLISKVRVNNHILFCCFLESCQKCTDFYVWFKK